MNGLSSYSQTDKLYSFWGNCRPFLISIYKIITHILTRTRRHLQGKFSSHSFSYGSFSFCIRHLYRVGISFSLSHKFPILSLYVLLPFAVGKSSLSRFWHLLMPMTMICPGLIPWAIWRALCFLPKPLDRFLYLLTSDQRSRAVRRDNNRALERKGRGECLAI